MASRTHPPPVPGMPQSPWRWPQAPTGVQFSYGKTAFLSPGSCGGTLKHPGPGLEFAGSPKENHHFRAGCLRGCLWLFLKEKRFFSLICNKHPRKHPDRKWWFSLRLPTISCSGPGCSRVPPQEPGHRNAVLPKEKCTSAGACAQTRREHHHSAPTGVSRWVWMRLSRLPF